jgi:hypothetical protein
MFAYSIIQQVCNKYFLRQHVSQRHKISFQEYSDRFGQVFGKKQRPSAVANVVANVARAR